MKRQLVAGKPGSPVLVSHNCVFDASLVPETWQDWFVDSTGVTSQVPGESSPEKVAAKLFILQGSVGATFFRSCLGGAQSIAYRNVGMRGVSRISRAEIRVA